MENYVLTEFDVLGLDNTPIPYGWKQTGKKGGYSTDEDRTYIDVVKKYYCKDWNDYIKKVDDDTIIVGEHPFIGDGYFETTDKALADTLNTISDIHDYIKQIYKDDIKIIELKA